MSRRGALTGGYYDTRKSRLELQKGKMECLVQLQQEEQEYEGHKAKLQNILERRGLGEGKGDWGRGRGTGGGEGDWGRGWGTGGRGLGEGD